MKEFLLRSILAANTVVASNTNQEISAVRGPASVQPAQVENSSSYEYSNFTDGASEFFGYQKHLVIFNF